MFPASAPAQPATPPHEWKGKRRSAVQRWDVVTIGNLSRNRYWRERDAKGVRPVICTCTLITGSGFRLLVDPSLANAQQMEKELDRRTGLKPRDMTAVFVTHGHGDHWAGIRHFLEARGFASPGVAECSTPRQSSRDGWKELTAPCSQPARREPANHHVGGFRTPPFPGALAGALPRRAAGAERFASAVERHRPMQPDPLG